MMSFAAPLFLLALTALPLFWLLLRLTPPRPHREVFPPFDLLKQLVNKEQTAAKSPWWLLLLRLFMIALVIVALSKPVFRAQEKLIAPTPSLVMMLDNSFAAASAWEARLRVARQLLGTLSEESRVYLLPTVAEENMDLLPFQPQEALDRLEEIKPQPLAADRLLAMRRLQEIISQEGKLQWVYLNDGLQTQDDAAAFALLEIEHVTDQLIKTLWYQGDIEGIFGLAELENTADSLRITAIRAPHTTTATKTVIAYDREARRLGDVEMTFPAGESQAHALLALPFEMRNDVAFVRIEGERQTAAIFVNASTNARRRIAILAPDTAEMLQPLVSPLYYPAQALRPYADLVFMGSGGLSQNFDQLLAVSPSLIVMGDEAAIAREDALKLENWIEQGGSLLRFAGSHLAASKEKDHLLPVTLRRGERSLGGIMVWQTPQKISPPPPNSPLFGLQIPQDVTISRQILPEPSPDLHAKSWINLEDGTPLVTATKHGQGWLIFVHTAGVPDWSNLPLSGFFVDMMRRFVALTHQPLYDKVGDLSEMLPLAAWQIISPQGDLVPASSLVASPLITPVVLMRDYQASPSLANPPGLYGTDDFFVAINLLNKDSQFTRLMPPSNLSFSQHTYDIEEQWALQGIFWGWALALFALDSLIMLFQTAMPVFSWRKQATATIVFMGGMMLCWPADILQAQESNFAQKTHLAFIKTGDHALDALSQAGLDSLSRFIGERTSIDLGAAVGVLLEKDELAFYPLIYWPVEARQPLPSAAAIARLDAYMRQGGTVLFDTRDYLLSNMARDDAPTEAVQRLREILANLNIPPLEPAPPNHVIARSFYIMPDFPGRYQGGPLWLALSEGTMLGDERAGAVQSGDGVGSILITANDFIGAWAEDGEGQWLFLTVPDEPMQRLWALRGGLNIVLYLLTGNYKADQIHAVEILERLGQ